MEQLIGRGVPWDGELRPDDKTWAIIAHISPLVISLISGGLLAFLGPLIVWAIRKAESPYIANQAMQALYFSLLPLVVGILVMLLSCCTAGFGVFIAVPIALLFFVYYIIVVVMATIKAGEGLAYQYPFVADMVK